jgi:hypothetical protein
MKNTGRKIKRVHVGNKIKSETVLVEFPILATNTVVVINGFSSEDS